MDRIVVGRQPYRFVTIFAAPDGTEICDVPEGEPLIITGGNTEWVEVHWDRPSIDGFVRRRTRALHADPAAAAGAAVPPPAAGHWRCGGCGLDNADAVGRCRLCETPNAAAQEREEMCMSCYCEHPLAELLTLWQDAGGCGHHICVEGLQAMVSAACGKDGKLACSIEGCGATVPQHLVRPHVSAAVWERLHQVQLDTALNAARSVRGGPDGEARPAGQGGKAFIKCPKCQVSAAPPRRAGRVVCHGCGHDFCSKCVTPRLHYHLNDTAPGAHCEAILREKKVAWLQWRAEGQAAYLRELQRVDAEHARALQAFKQDESAQRRVLEAFQADEEMKKGWVHCPHCNALWAGTDACPSVTCGVLGGAGTGGYDNIGGADANVGGLAHMQGKRGAVGCGRTFNFAQAKRTHPYKPAAPPKLDELDRLDRPRKGQQVLHSGAFCARCRSEIRGPRFLCLHCPCYNLCLRCLVERGPAHDGEKRWPGAGQPHVFDVIHRPADGGETREVCVGDPADEAFHLFQAQLLLDRKDAHALTRVPNGAHVLFVREAGGFTCVRYQGLQGWVKSGHLKAGAGPAVAEGPDVRRGSFSPSFSPSYSPRSSPRGSPRGSRESPWGCDGPAAGVRARLALLRAADGVDDAELSIALQRAC